MSSIDSSTTITTTETLLQHTHTHHHLNVQKAATLISPSGEEHRRDSHEKIVYKRLVATMDVVVVLLLVAVEFACGRHHKNRAENRLYRVFHLLKLDRRSDVIAGLLKHHIHRDSYCYYYYLVLSSFRFSLPEQFTKYIKM
jgi:hypothetical protein